MRTYGGTKIAPVPGREGHGDFDARAFGILIAVRKLRPPLGKVFTNGDFFLEAAAANAGKDGAIDAAWPRFCAWESRVLRRSGV